MDFGEMIFGAMVSGGVDGLWGVASGGDGLWVSSPVDG